MSLHDFYFKNSSNSNGKTLHNLEIWPDKWLACKNQLAMTHKKWWWENYVVHNSIKNKLIRISLNNKSLQYLSRKILTSVKDKKVTINNEKPYY